MLKAAAAEHKPLALLQKYNISWQGGVRNETECIQ